MVAYYQEVHKLEDKFNGLELYHILKWDSEMPTTCVCQQLTKALTPT
jgi:hypothetical protein